MYGSGLVKLINESHVMPVSDLMSESSIRFPALDREMQKESQPIDIHLLCQRLQDFVDVNVPVPDLLAIRKLGMFLYSKFLSPPGDHLLSFCPVDLPGAVIVMGGKVPVLSSG